MINFFGKELSREELLKRVGNLSQVASIKPYELKDGRAKGLRAFDITTGSGLDFTVLESKCLDILDVKYKGINLNFISKPGLVSPDGNGFLRNFQGGMLYTCGLSNVGSACIDDGVEYSLHGKIGCTPAEKVSAVSEWRDDEYILEIFGEMREAALFNENLVLRRRISTKLGAKSIEIHDEVENQGFEEQALMLLYHFNFGYPMLDEGARLIIPGLGVTPRDEDAQKGVDKYHEFSSPIDHFREQVFYHKVSHDEDGKTYAALVNDKLEIGTYIRFNADQLPQLIQWKSMMSGDYALGIEPANCLVEGRAQEKKRGTLKKIGPFERVCFDLELGILDGPADIAKIEEKVESLKR